MFGCGVEVRGVWRCWGTWPLVKYNLRRTGVQGGVITKGQREEKRKERRRVTRNRC
jgi:hypothetical protein